MTCCLFWTLISGQGWAQTRDGPIWAPHAFGHSDGHLTFAKTAVEKVGPALVGEHVTPNNYWALSFQPVEGANAERQEAEPWTITSFGLDAKSLLIEPSRGLSFCGVRGSNTKVLTQQYYLSTSSLPWFPWHLIPFFLRKHTLVSARASWIFVPSTKPILTIQDK